MIKTKTLPKGYFIQFQQNYVVNFVGDNRPLLTKGKIYSIVGIQSFPNNFNYKVAMSSPIVDTVLVSPDEIKPYKGILKLLY